MDLIERTRVALMHYLEGIPSAKLVLALSGGMDSITLLDVLHSLAQTMGFQLIAAHLDHGMRLEAGEDACFVASLCQRYGVECMVSHTNVPALVQKTGASPEDTARQVRYAFLAEVKQNAGAQYIVTAHHQRDQAETLLLRLGRGTSLRGLGGMHARQGDVIRPFLDIPYEAICAYAQLNRLVWREDATNGDVRIPRNAMRHRVLPALQAVYPDAQMRIAAAARQLQQDEECLAMMAKPLLKDLHVGEDGIWLLPLLPLAGAHPALQSRAIMAALAAAGMAVLPDSAPIQAVLALLKGRTGSWVDLVGGWRVWKDAEHLALGRPGTAPMVHAVPFPFCSSTLVMGGKKLCITVGTSSYIPGQLLDASAIPADAVFRLRQPGDWMQPLGMTGRRKLKEILIDDKYPRRLRDGLVLLATGSRVLYVLGTGRVDDTVKVTSCTKRFVGIQVTVYKEEI